VTAEGIWGRKGVAKKTKSAGHFAPWRSAGKTRRKLRRWAVRVAGTFHTAGNSFPCKAHDLSPGGARIEVVGRTRVKVGAATSLELPGYGRIPAQVKHISGNSLGLMFTHDEEHAAALARFLIAKPPPRPQPRRPAKAVAVLLVRDRRVPCSVEDISSFGAKVRVNDTNGFAEDQEVLLRIDGHGSLPAIVRRVEAGEIGLVLVEAFVGDLSRDARSKA